MAWRETIDKLKKLPQKALDLLQRADETELHDKIERFHKEIERQIERYVEGMNKIEEAKEKGVGKAIGMAGKDLRQVGKRLRSEVREVVHLLKKVKSKKYLKEADAWREEIQKLLDQLNQDIDIRRASIAQRVAARYKAANGTPQKG
jgi:frataxin-like iron-binding protein CyaY